MTTPAFPQATLENHQLLVQQQEVTVAVVSENTTEQDIPRREQDKKQAPEHARRMTERAPEVKCWQSATEQRNFCLETA